MEMLTTISAPNDGTIKNIPLIVPAWSQPRGGC